MEAFRQPGLRVYTGMFDQQGVTERSRRCEGEMLRCHGSLQAAAGQHAEHLAHVLGSAFADVSAGVLRMPLALRSLSRRVSK